MDAENKSRLVIDGGHLIVRTGRCGTWIEFKATNGRSAALNIEALAEERFGIIGSALKQWCVDRQAEFAREGK